MSNVIIIFVRKKHECIFSCIMHVRCETIDYLFGLHVTMHHLIVTITLEESVNLRL